MASFESSKDSNYSSSLIVLSTLFFMWGLLTVLSGFLVPELIKAFPLTYPKALLIFFIFFGSYFIISFPAGILIDKVGFRKGIISGVIIAAMGCFLFYLAADKRSYELTVLSLFVLASGITILQVGANPYVFLIGMRGRGASRLTLVQGFNSLGTVIASYFGVNIVSSETGELDPESIKAASAELVKGPYLMLGGVLLLLAIFLAFSKLPKIDTKNAEPLIKDSIPPRKSIFQFPHLVLGAIAIFAYVGAEVSIFRFLLTKETSNGMVKTMLEFYWGGAMIGRFVGAYLLTKISPRKAMGFSSLIASLLVLGFIMMVPDAAGDWNGALWLIVAVGLFNSVLFPCIFTMGIDGLGKYSEEGSSLLNMSIVGGAVIPFIVANLVTEEPSSVKLAFLVPLACYLFIVFFGLKGSRYEKRTNFY
jgi:MFS transporter, FHS family, L-fucose permease